MLSPSREAVLIIPWWLYLWLGVTGLGMMTILVLMVYQIMQHRHVFLFYEVIFAERVRQLDQQAQELQGLEARVETQAKTLQGLEWCIREMEARLSPAPAASDGNRVPPAP